MEFFPRLGLACSALLLVGLGPVCARGESAQDQRQPGPALHFGLNLGHALAGYQAQELGWGGQARLSAEWIVSPAWGLEFGASALYLSGRGAVAPSGLAELQGASGVQAGLGLRLFPLLSLGQSDFAHSLALVVEPGLGLTGGRLAPRLGLRLGYEWGSGALRQGPELAYEWMLPLGQVPREGALHYLGLGWSLSWGRAAEPRLTDTSAQVPELDQDGDGIPDSLDQCRPLAEDLDGFQDEDGCPEFDNDGDALRDELDHCPDVAEDADGFHDEDGCPELDNDEDGVNDPVDRCPLEAEDRDFYQDEDGCPEFDNDGDQIVDALDLCPNEPETENGYADQDGCPDEQFVKVVGDRIELEQKIHFFKDSAIIRGISYPVLHKLARFLKEHPEYLQISVEGHADDRGTAEVNHRISQKRAEAVAKFLIKDGVAASRIHHMGYGATRPSVPGRSEYAMFLNRRVEFIVTRNIEVRGGRSLSGPEGARP